MDQVEAVESLGGEVVQGTTGVVGAEAVGTWAGVGAEAAAGLIDWCPSPNAHPCAFTIPYDVQGLSHLFAQ